jgi:phosphatidate cytidylyltransferase
MFYYLEINHITLNYYYEEKLSVSYFVISAAVLAVVSQIGDIFESSIKRSLNLKDSSNLIPGHGGIFDRVDGLLFAAPVVAIFVLINQYGFF